MVTAQICGSSINPNGNFVQYRISVCRDDGSQPYFVLRRYNEFYVLDQQLRSVFPSLPELPPKSWFVNMCSGCLGNDRQFGLDMYIRSITHFDPHGQNSAVRWFLDLGPAVQLYVHEQVPEQKPQSQAYPVENQGGQPYAQAGGAAFMQPGQSPPQPQYAAQQAQYAAPPAQYTAPPAQFAAPQSAPCCASPQYQSSPVLCEPEHEHNQGGMSAATAGVLGAVTGAVGGMLLERALEEPHHTYVQPTVIEHRSPWIEEVSAPNRIVEEQVSRDFFGNPVITEESVETDMWGNRCEKQEIIRQDLFGHRHVVDREVDTDMWGNTVVREETYDEDDNDW